MATLAKGVTYTTTSIVSSQSLHDLIEGATVGNVVPGDIAGGAVQFSLSATLAPDASIYPFWYSQDPQDPIFRVFARPWNIWLAVGPHRIEVPLQNGAATDLALGTLVVQSPTGTPSQFSIGSNPSLNAIGFLQSSAASGAFAPVGILGIGFALWASAVSSTYRALTAGDTIHSRHVIAGAVHGLGVNVASACSFPAFGYFRDTARSGTTLSFTPVRVQMWGPRVGFKGGW